MQTDSAAPGPTSGWLRRIEDPGIRTIYGTVLALGVAYGLAVSLVAIYLKDRGVAEDQIGSLAIFFALGIVGLAIPAGIAIRRFGARTVLAVALVGYALSVGLFPFGNGLFQFGVLRFFDGAFSVAVWVASESYLLARAPRGDKAFFTSLYAIALALGYVIGPFVAGVVVALVDKASAFYAAGVLAVATAVFVWRLLPQDRLSDGAAHGEAASSSGLSARALLLRIKMSCLATFSYGYFQASLVLFLPLYLKAQGLTETQTIIAPAFFAGGMLLFANFAARLGDRVGHLRVMTILGTIGTLTVLGFLFAKSVPVVYATAFVAGASLASVSPVSLALQGLVTPEEDLPRAGGFYNAAYALGMLLGPPVSGLLFTRDKGPLMVIHFACLWGVFVVASIVFRRDDPRARARRLPVG